jgi:hypothetical protein
MVTADWRPRQQGLTVQTGAGTMQPPKFALVCEDQPM